MAWAFNGRSVNERAENNADLGCLRGKTARRKRDAGMVNGPSAGPSAGKAPVKDKNQRSIRQALMKGVDRSIASGHGETRSSYCYASLRCQDHLYLSISPIDARAKAQSDNMSRDDESHQGERYSQSEGLVIIVVCREALSDIEGAIDSNIHRRTEEIVRLDVQLSWYLLWWL